MIDFQITTSLRSLTEKIDYFQMTKGSTQMIHMSHETEADARKEKQNISSQPSLIDFKVLSSPTSCQV